MYKTALLSLEVQSGNNTTYNSFIITPVMVSDMRCPLFPPPNADKTSQQFPYFPLLGTKQQQVCPLVLKCGRYP